MTILHQILPSPAVPRRGTLSVYVCIKKIGGCVCGGGYFLISVAGIRYRHDLVRLCHKFHFCPFHMKIAHIDEEKEMYCVSYRGLCPGFFVLRVRGSRSQKFFGATQRLRASWTCLLNSIGKISYTDDVFIT